MVAIIIADGFEDAEALCPYDLLRRAGVDVRLIGLAATEGTGKTCGTVLRCAMTAQELLDSGERIEMLVLPGGIPGATNIDAAPITDLLIEKTERDGGFFAAICAAPLVYGKRGMLRGFCATAYPDYLRDLDGAQLSDLAVVRDGRFITAAGMGAAIDFGIELIGALCGSAVKNRVARSVCRK